ncbi:fibronectin type-III domain-containing protein 3A [Trichonephila inaurata madagascariensis]|uniref:Fibronectin type-III domain-containing protein 3A n=1 Tax=Trichonephila inaurata madagascariensis TaxID=2747483 RepID=A0A8X6IWS7_9ARAC|nr:fibronectin type-III domain-containing protein 3A [Trichonephila inaurata madagascariensis]
MQLSLENKTEDITPEPSEDTESNSFSNNDNTELKNNCETVEKKENEQVKSEETVFSSGSDSTNENSSSRPGTSNVRVLDEKRLNGVKPLPNNSKFNVLGNSLPLAPETWTVTSDSQIWLECCQNSFRACGGNGKFPNLILKNRESYCSPQSPFLCKGHPVPKVIVMPIR